MINSNDPELSMRQGGPCSAPTRTWVSEVALMTVMQDGSDSRQEMPQASDDPLLTTGQSGPCSGPIKKRVSEAAPLTNQQRRARRASTVTSGSDDPPATKTNNGARSAPAKSWAADDPLLTARQSVDELNISLPAFWKAVAEGRPPTPLYVLPRAPRWRLSELRAVSEGNRMLPAEAKLARWNYRHKTI